MYKHILIPTDGSELAEKAISHGLPLARALEARVTVFTVVEPFHVLSIDPEQLRDTAEGYAHHARARAERLLQRAKDQASAAGVTCETAFAEGEQPFRAIVDEASSRGCDLILMSSHGRGGVSALMLGSQTGRVLSHTKIPVLVCR